MEHPVFPQDRPRVRSSLCAVGLAINLPSYEAAVVDLTGPAVSL
jgi:hypothetical protein